MQPFVGRGMWNGNYSLSQFKCSLRGRVIFKETKSLYFKEIKLSILPFMILKLCTVVAFSLLAPRVHLPGIELEGSLVE